MNRIKVTYGWRSFNPSFKSIAVDPVLSPIEILKVEIPNDINCAVMNVFDTVESLFIDVVL